jgi:hypothetical protein
VVGECGQATAYLNTNNYWDDALFGFVVFTDSASVGYFNQSSSGPPLSLLSWLN